MWVHIYNVLELIYWWIKLTKRRRNCYFDLYGRNYPLTSVISLNSPRKPSHFISVTLFIQIRMSLQMGLTKHISQSSCFPKFPETDFTIPVGSRSHSYGRALLMACSIHINLNNSNPPTHSRHFTLSTFHIHKNTVLRDTWSDHKPPQVWSTTLQPVLPPNSISIWMNLSPYIPIDHSSISECDSARALMTAQPVNFARNIHLDIHIVIIPKKDERAAGQLTAT